MTDETSYDRGYASIDKSRCVGRNAFNVAADFGMWGPATIRLHLGWLSAQLKADPRDQFRWGRYDALCDVLVSNESFPYDLENSALRNLQGSWWKQN